ncbi:smp-30 gluconolaconase lre-like region containing protein [Ophiostoma piceae UAMH 11346]|uniref:Smp-30 gluconolaconase lre-like region containing protein n=1 Tax=Ophiostoma piceae (strain UAMH 11346) TaxID=1262450 RepID=S3CSI0_OPHP1|nr:smp-30 gluconolaconase lre-like region containing protein [Ophiostoma piceae UAMH 11346]
MAATVNSNIEIKQTPLIQAAVPGDFQPNGTRRPSSAGICLSLHHASAAAGLVRDDAPHALLLSTASSSANSLFYGGCAVVTERGDGGGDSEVLYTTSSLLQTTDSSQLPVVLITRIVVQRSTSSAADTTGPVAAVSWTKLRPPPIMPMPAAMIPYRFQESSGMLYCAQGNLAPKTSGLFFMPHGRRPQALVNSYYGIDFNSVRDVAVHPRDGSLWFTDPRTGSDQDFRNEPQLPCHVYRAATDVRVMDDGLRRPTSLCFDPAGSTLYVSDTNNTEGVRTATVYAFDVLERGGSEFLANRRVFAYALEGAPMCVRCDGHGNVFAACGSRIEIRNAGGTLVASVDVPGPSDVSSFCFTSDRCNEMYVCAGQELWWIRLRPN